MNRLISWLQNVRVRAILTTFIVGIALLANVTLGVGNPLRSQNSILLASVDTSSYRVDADNNSFPTYGYSERTNNPDLIENSRDKLKGAADNIREKLNLDEPLPKSTKDFLNQVEGKVEQVTKPITKGSKNSGN